MVGGKGWVSGVEGRSCGDCRRGALALLPSRSRCAKSVTWPPPRHPTNQLMPHASSRAPVMRDRTHAADSGNSEIDTQRSTYGATACPCDWAPTTKTGVAPADRDAANDLRPTASGATRESATLGAPGGRCFSTGPLITRNSLSGPLDARMESLCRSWTKRPQNRLNVRGRRTAGLTWMSTFFEVWM